MKETKEFKEFTDVIKEFVGQKCAVICARYQYRGILANVLEDCIVLSNPSAIEVSGPTNSDRPTTEDPIDGSIVIKHDAIELFYQPRWCFAPLAGE